MKMITKKDVERCLERLTEEDISNYYDADVKNGEETNFRVYITVGEYDYEISADEILYRAALIEENEIK